MIVSLSLKLNCTYSEKIKILNDLPYITSALENRFYLEVHDILALNIDLTDSIFRLNSGYLCYMNASSDVDDSTDEVM